MSLNSFIIESAFREANYVGQADVLSDVLTDVEKKEGLQLLQSLVDSFFGLVVGIKPMPWYIPDPMIDAPKNVKFPASTTLRHGRDARYPPANSRVFLRNKSPQTVTFQSHPEDGAFMQLVDAGFTGEVTIEANGQFFGTTDTKTVLALQPAVSGGSRVKPKTYIYRGDLAAWNEITQLTYEGESAFPPEFDDFFITALAIRLAPRHGNRPNEVTILRNKDMMVYARGWYRQTAEATGNGPESAASNYWRGSLGDPNTGGWT